MTAPQPFHHGNLRAALLEAAETTLREQGVDALSLRDLARRVGVSHGAPRSHFIDRQALLDALAVRGFTRLSDELDSTIASGGDFEHCLRSVARAYVGFAVTDAALMDLMFTAKNATPSPDLTAAASRLFDNFGGLIQRGVRDGKLTAVDPLRLQLLFAALLQGTATLLASGRITQEQGDLLIVDALRLLGAPVGPGISSS
jgi:AcrR family transcriptional regulator